MRQAWGKGQGHAMKKKSRKNREEGPASGKNRKRKRPVYVLVFFCAGCLLLAAAANLRMILTVSDRIVSPEEVLQEADCILVLGAGVREDGTPSQILAARLDTALALYEKGVSSRLLMSGDHGRKEYDEVNVMKRQAVEAGIPSEAVFMDHAGFCTYDSLYRARDIFQARRIVIVTQRYHLYRALYIAGALGLDAVGVAAAGEEYSGQVYREMREWAARTKDFVTVIVKPKASVMGEVIPVSGNGDGTND